MNVIPDNVIIFHANCMDGAGAAWAYWFNKEATNHTDFDVYFPMQYGDMLPNYIGESTNVIFLDFSIKLDEMKDLCTKCRSVTVIDHHESSKVLEQIKDDKFIFIHSSHSGAVLTWLTYSRDSVPYFLKLIEDRDTWAFTLVDAKPFHAAVSAEMVGQHNSFKSMNKFLSAKTVDEYIETGKAMLLQRNAIIESSMPYVEVFTLIDGTPAMLVNSLHILASDTAEQIKKTFSMVEAYGTYHLYGGFLSVSIRSDGEEVDVSKIAEQYGGGGHKAAAGFKINLQGRTIQKALAEG